jgi:phosphoadenosine phosphosulfate reductase
VIAGARLDAAIPHCKNPVPAYPKKAEITNIRRHFRPQKQSHLVKAAAFLCAAPFGEIFAPQAETNKRLFLDSRDGDVDNSVLADERRTMTPHDVIERTAYHQSPKIFTEQLDQKLARLDLAGRLSLASEIGHAVFTTSLGIEDQVITAAIGTHRLPIEVSTLETGRLFAETVELISETEDRYDISIRRFRPEQDDIDEYAAKYGLNGFYESVEARHACCHVRKLVPLAKALSGADVWITGLRRGQSGNRATTPFAEYDAERNLIKINPLADWDIDRIKAHVTAKAIPINPLHARGYPSIGCEPCTRAIKPGEPERAGRWWWENDEKRECGLHVPDTHANANASQPVPQASSIAR